MRIKKKKIKGKERRVEWHVLKPTHNIHTEHMFLIDCMTRCPCKNQDRRRSSLKRDRSESFKPFTDAKQAIVLQRREGSCRCAVSVSTPERNASRCRRKEKSNSISSSCSRQQYVFAISLRKRTGCRSSCEAETDCETTPLKERWELDVHRCETLTTSVRDDSEKKREAFPFSIPCYSQQ